jgi:hypothetical protein
MSAYRLSAFQYFDQYNVGPFGPISSCYKYHGYYGADPNGNGVTQP